MASRLLCASSASAQAWIGDPKRAAGRGIRLGSFELHPGIGTEVGYDSNVFLSPSGKTQDSAVLRVGPYIYLSTLTDERLRGETQRVSFRAGANGSLKDYFSFSERTDIGVGQDADLKLQPSPIFGLEIFDDFHRSIDPFIDIPKNSAGIRPKIGYQRDQLGLGGRMQLSTPGGLLKGGLGYRFDLDAFEDPAFKSNANNTHSILADTSWEFLPKTAIVWSGSVRMRNFSSGQVVTVGVPQRNDITLVASRIELNGALTDRFGFTIAGGYSAGFAGDQRDFESVIAQVEGRWRIQDQTSLSLGYDRELSPAFQGNFNRIDRIKSVLRTTFATAWVLGASAELGFLKFGHDSNLTNPDRSDKQLVLDLNGEYRVLRWLALTGDLNLRKNITDYVFVFTSTTPGVADAVLPAEYTALTAWFGVRAFF